MGAVVHYLKTFSNRWEREPRGQPVFVPAESPVTSASIEHGKVLFQANCAFCHGEAGKADGPLAAPGLLIDSWGEAVKPAHLSLPAGVSGGVKLGHDAARLFLTIRAGIGGTPMPTFEGLDLEEVWDLVH